MCAQLRMGILGSIFRPSQHKCTEQEQTEKQRLPDRRVLLQKLYLSLYSEAPEERDPLWNLKADNYMVVS